MGNTSEKATEAIVEQANEWLVRLQDPASSLTQATQFTEWLQRSPVHVQEYLRAESTWAALSYIDPERSIDIDALLREEGQSNVISIDLAVAEIADREEPYTTRSRVTGTVAAAVAMCGLMFAAVWYLAQPQTLLYETARGEQRRVVMADGSVIDMNTQSEIVVRLSDEERQVELVKGEALFKVAKDPDRPFIVTSGLAVVRALGTQFNVYQRADQVLVTVLEGRVAVENMERTAESLPAAAANLPVPPVELVAGDQAEVIATAPIRKLAANAERTVAWTKRRLIFENQELFEIVAEFNRYNKRQLVIQDSELGAERISGVFDADQPDALVRFLARNPQIETVELNKFKLLIQRRQ